MKTILKTLATVLLLLAISTAGAWAQPDVYPTPGGNGNDNGDVLREPARDGSCLDDPTATLQAIGDQEPDRLRIKLQLKDGSCLTDDQQALVDQNMASNKAFRSQLSATFTEEQLAILENGDLTRAQKQEQLKNSFTIQQQEMVQAQSQLRVQQREQLKAGLSGEQMQQMRKRYRQSDNSDPLAEQVQNRFRKHNGEGGN